MNVIPIPPSYNKDESLCLKDTAKYLKFLEKYRCPKGWGTRTIMTTAGTSQFNLLDQNEIRSFNECVSDFDGKVILGLPPLSLNQVIKFIKNSRSNNFSNWMALYPDRYYDDESIIDYFKRIREHTNSPIYLHGMFARSGYGGHWNYTSDILNKLWEDKVICGIKEEHSELQKSYNVLQKLPFELDIIVAGGSMRRHQFLRSAGANSFLAGIGNLFPRIEERYVQGISMDHCLEQESKLFSVFGKHGWHRSLRIALSLLDLGCHYDRMPYPKRKKEVVDDIKKVLEQIK
tara:strand:- start:377 stop:1243 length:867 start_codon:yes stop_codon:yes gene_type:complete